MLLSVPVISSVVILDSEKAGACATGDMSPLPPIGGKVIVLRSSLGGGVSLSTSLSNTDLMYSSDLTGALSPFIS